MLTISLPADTRETGLFVCININVVGDGVGATRGSWFALNFLCCRDFGCGDDGGGDWPDRFCFGGGSGDD
jgi:hypothetical protein